MIKQLLRELAAEHVRLRRTGDQISVFSDKETLDPALIEALRAHKSELLEMIGNDGDGWWDPPAVITPDMLPLVVLTQDQIDRIVDSVPGGVANVQDIYPLAPLQEGILFHHLMAKDGDAYLLPTLYSFEDRQRLDAYLGALQAVVDRHDILRTAVMWDGLPEPVQVVHRHAPLAVEEVVLDDQPGNKALELYERFNPRHTRVDLHRAPMMRIYIAYDRAENRWLLLLLLHHLVGDHTTMDRMQDEIRAHMLGQAAALPAPLPFRNFVAQGRLGISREEHEAFFRSLLGDVTESTAPFGLIDVQGDGSGIGEAQLDLDDAVASRLRNVARKLGVSAASLCHLAWALVLSRTCGRRDVVFGTVLFGRMQGGEGADRAMGLFINTLPLRLTIGDESTETAARRAHTLLADLLRHEHASLALAQRCSGVPAPAPLFSSILNYRHSPTWSKPASAEARQAWKGVKGLLSEERTNYPLALSVDDLGDGFRFTAQVHSSIEPMRICRFMETAIAALVDALENAPAQPLRALDVLPSAEREQVLEAWNRTDASFPTDVCVHELFEAQVRRAPESVAVRQGDRSLTYAELNARANQLAHHLRALGVRCDDRVAICVERCPEMIVGLLAIAKAGGAYVPIDPDTPLQRVRNAIEDCAPVAVLTQASLQDRFAGVPVIDLFADLPPQPETNLDRDGLTPSDLAYVIYTSGSTGTPKGVAVEHRNLANLIGWHCAAFDLKSGSRSSSVAGFGFDASTWEIWPPLSVGAELLLPPHGLDPEALLRWWEREDLDVSFLPTPLAELAFTGGIINERLTTLLVGGDRLRHVREEPLPFTLVNNYGPTENTVVATSGVVDSRLHIGRPIANTRVYILDGDLRPVPAGVPGELFVSGAGVARGYLNRPELTAERFLADPFRGDARMYRTGDLAKWLPDGTIEFLGRNDHQVKVRGFRIELGEIEAQLARHADVREAIVIARDGRLIAYYTAERELDASALRDHLAAVLPDYMLPAAVVFLPALPLTLNGKVDRAALPMPEEAIGAAPFEAPAGELESIVADVWTELLRVPRIGRHGQFFDLGGHSLLAVQVVSRLRHVLGVDVAVGDLFSHPVLADFARAVAAAGRAELPPVMPAERGDRVELSFAQQRLWFIDHLEGSRGIYHVPGAVRMKGDLDRASLVRALDAIVARHEVLRTTFVQTDGRPLQRIAAEGHFHLVEHDLRSAADVDAELRRLIEEEAADEFDLEQGPLVRGRFVRLAEDEWALLVTMHHIVSDGWSMTIFINELSALYAAFSRGHADPLPPLPLQYADYAAWQRRRIDVLQAQTDYWKTALAGAPELLELPSDRVRPAQQDFAGSFLEFALDENLTGALKALSKRHGTTLFMTLLAGWGALMARLSGQEDVVIGSPSANRGRAELEGLIGCFVNTLPLRIDVSGSPSVAQLLERVKTGTLAAQQNQDIPFEQIVEIARPARSLAHSPLFQVVLTWQNVPGGQLELPGLSLSPLAAAPHTTSLFDLTLTLQDANGKIIGGLEYATSLFDRETVDRALGHFRTLLEGMAADDGAAIDSLPLLNVSQREQLTRSRNLTRQFFDDACIHHLFETQVSLTPDAVALVVGETSLTYAELNRRANRLAHHLRTLGVKPDGRVAICVERSAEMVVGLLAVLKAGGGYVPLDPAYPADRLRYMVEDSAPAVVLTQPHLKARFNGIDALVLDLSDETGWINRPDVNPRVEELRSEHLAYVIYTSGSTGAPKGVMVEHRNVVRLFTATDDWFRFGSEDVWTLFHSFAFDFSVWEIWGALLHGGKLVVVPQDTARSPEEFYALVCREGVTILNQTPSAFRQFMAAQSGSSLTHQLRHVIFGGEALEVPMLKPWFAQNDERDTVLVNMYGITETTVHVTYRPIAKADTERRGASPIGCRIPDLRTYILDSHRQPVPVGVTGELYVGGAGVARGYLNRPELTAERFLADPFADGRMYKTGDLGRWLPDGSIEFLGRNDFQVKIRGYRIELGEIEARLAEHPGIREVALIARQDERGDKRLVAYYAGAEELSAETLRMHVSATLPDYMVPSAYVRLERLPLTANGKLDRKALPEPETNAYASRPYEAPQGETETALAEVWAELLNVERVGRHDNFFELGGHSLLAVTLIERMRRRNLHADVRTLFATPTLAELAAAAENRQDIVEVPPNLIPPGCEAITPDMVTLVALTQDEIDTIVAGVTGGAANVQDIYPLAPLQEGILFHHLMGDESDVYLNSRVESFRTRERLDAYLAAMQAVMDRHDMLRTAVVWEGVPEPVQVVWRKVVLPVEEVAIDPAAGDVALQLWQRLDPRRNRLDIRKAPMLRLFVAADPKNERWLLQWWYSHLLEDHTTLEVIHSEVQAHLMGQQDRLPAPLPFRNFVAQARLGVTREEYERFFTQLLGDVDEPTAPFGLLDVRGDGRDMHEARMRVDDGVAKRLRACARKLGVSAASLCHLAWSTVIAKLAGRDDVVFGTVLFGRMQGGEGADRVLGMFINTLPVRMKIAGESVESSARRMHVLLADLMRHEHASLAMAQRCSAVPAPAPLFSSLLNYRHSAAMTQKPAPEVARAWEGISGIYGEERTNYPLTVSIDDLAGGFILSAQAQDVIGPKRVCTFMHTALERLVEALEERPSAAVKTIDILPADERSRVLDGVNATAMEYRAEALMHELFEEQVKRAPDAIALVHHDESLTYTELNRRANKLARHLRSLGVGPDARVGICLDRGARMLVSMLAVLKAGGAYVPLDPAYPADRLQFMTEDSEPVVVIDRSFSFDEASYEDGDPQRNGTTSSNLAYVIYTSGSTGKPKGVAIEHRNAVNFITWAQRNFDREVLDRTLFSTSLSFDLAVFETFVPLSVGASLRIVANAMEVADDVTLINTVPSAIDALTEIGGVAPAVRTINLAGEPLKRVVVEKIFATTNAERVCNLYGPSETTTYSSWVEMPRAEGFVGHIGRPVANTQIYLLDSERQPVPVGVVGEIYIGGAGVARGYLNRPELTAERFLDNPFAPGRMYKTGDLGRWLPEGNLEFLGRNDHQVKIRGFRIELGEIEARLAAHPEVKDAVVIARDERLIAYYAGEETSEKELRSHIAAKLPEHMVPSLFVRLEALPLTPNGKIDRKALPAPEMDGRSAEYEAPMGEVETALGEIWAEVLKLERVGRKENFFELGGHSLLAVTVIERMRRKGLHADVRALFASPTIAQLAAEVGSETQQIEVPANAIPLNAEAITPEMLPLVELTQTEIDSIVSVVPGGAANVQDIYPLAPLQEGILFHHLMDREGDTYLLSSLLGFDTRERLDAFTSALQAVVDRHDILRTAVMWEGLAQPVQVVCRTARLAVEEVTAQSAEQLYEEFNPRRYRLDIRRAPLMRLVIAKDAKGQWLMLLLLHHLAGDHSTMEVLQHEVEVFLSGKGSELPAPLPFRNFVAQARRGVSAEEHEAFFTKMLGDVDEPTAPFGLLDVQGDGSGIGEARVEIGRHLSERLHERARKLGVTTATICHVAWAQVLARAAGREDVVFGTVLFGRMGSDDSADRAMGLFINTLPVRITIGDDDVVTTVRHAHQRLADLLRHEHASLSLAQRCSAVPPPAPLFSALLNYRHTASSEGLRRAAGLTAIHVEERTNYPLTLSVDDAGESFSLTAQVQAPADALRVCRLMETALEQLAEALESAPSTTARRIDVLPASEREQSLEEWNATESVLPEGSLTELFEAQAERRADAVAVVEGDRSITYAELNARANRLAHHLRTRGVEPGDRVVVTMPRSAELVIAELAILKCGAAYVPVDATFPAERIAFMTADCGAKVVLRREDVDVTGPSENLGIGVSSETAAYVMYTSGSTGEPKGVVVPHRAVVRLVINNRYADFGPDDRVAFASNPAFDATTLEVWAPLLSGGRIVVIDQDVLLDPRQFGEALRRDGVTVLWMTVGLFNQYADDLDFGRLRYLIVGGDALDPRTIAKVLRNNPPQHLLNGYGPTETTTFAITHEIRSVEAGARSIPLGRPIGNTKIYILDERSEPVPVGVAGEIYIGGMGVALGYLNREDLTAERFVENPFHGGRMYRTGDVGRWLAGGTIEFLGRNDQQVKIRGFRIELGEIEARLGSHASLREVVVVAREGEDGKRLVAYYTSDEEVSAEALRAHVSQTLPEYMVPAAYVRLEAMPLTRNGKVDRKALPAPEGDAYATREYEEPQGEIEQTLATIWADVLKVERVGRHDNFFELGGHSLLAVTLIERMRQQGLHADVRALFATPTVAELAQRAGGEERRQIEVPPNRIPAGCKAITPEMLPLVELNESEIDRIVRSVAGGAENVQDIYPLAPLQEGILFHHLMANEGDAYLLSSMFAFDARERAERFVAAFQAVVNRHDILRTGVIWEGLREPVQVVWREAKVLVEEVQLDGTGGDAAAELYARFDPRRHRIDLRQAPLMRMVVARDEENDRWLLLLLFHHLIGDHTTMEVVHEEVESHLLGRGEELRPALPFRNFVAEARMGVSREEHEEFFRKLLGEVDEPTAPYGLLDVRGDGSAVGEARIEIEGTLARRVRERARKLGISAASLWHLAWAQVLARLSGREDVVFGTVLFGRMQGGAGADRVTGLFINTLPVRIRVDAVAAQTAARGTHDLLAELMRHEHASLALAQRCSAIEAPAPLFSALLNYRHSATAGRARSVDSPRAWAGITALYGEERTNYPVTVSIDDLGESFRVTAQVAEPIRPIRICQYLETALGNLVDALDNAPDAALSSLEVLPAAEREHVLNAGSSATLPVPADRCIHELFEEQVARTPRAIAVIDQDRSLTYEELNARANRLAHRLRAMGIGPDGRVALCLGRSLDMAVAIMAVLKAGGAYVPLDPALPADRLRFIFENNAPLLLLANGGREQLFAGSGVPVIDVSSDFDDQPATNLDRGGLTPANLAYVIYTSGSTGVPKGVMAEHRGAVNQLWAFCDLLRLTAADRVMWTTSYAFDPSVLEVFMPLIVGAPTIVVDSATKKDPVLLAEAVKKAGGTLLQATPATWRMLVESGWTGVKGLKALCGGEALTVELSAQLQARVGELWNIYGPTEGTVWATAEKVSDVSGDGRLTESIGRPIANMRIYILNAHGQPVPVGITGEIHVAGVQVTRGYMNRPDLTAEKFVVDPFHGAPVERMYKTGDLGRWRPDGSIEFIGRNDFQVKIRGFRIELGEIEACLATCPGVNQTVVIAREDVPGDRRLVAYYTGEELGAEALREHLASTLPTYMLPAAYVHLDAMPMTSTGKINRKTLPAPEGAAFIERRFEAPIGEVEEQLAAIWTEVLGRERIGRHDDFFDLGGHSLLVMQLVSRVRQTLGVDVALGDVFDSPVLSEFAGRLASRARTTQSMIVPAERTANMPLSFAQQRLWFLDQLDVAGAAYHIPVALSLVGPLDRPALRQALDRIVQRHEALRTTFHKVEGEPVQRTTTTGCFTLAERDLRGHPSAQDDLRAIVADEAKAPFDLTHGPLIRGQLIRLADDDHALLVTIHHIVSDGWSMGLFINELNTLYAAFHRGEADPLPPLPVQYADYAAWQRTSIAGDVLQEQADFWKTTLEGAPELLELPGDRPRPAQQSFAGDLVSFDLGDHLSSQIKLLSRRHGTTVFMTLLTACSALFARLSGREDLVIGTPTANRGQKEIEGLIGFFVNTLPLRIDVSGSPTVAELLARVKAQTLAAQQHQEIPFEQIVEIAAPVRSAAYTPVFQVLFALQNAETGFAFPELNVSTLEGTSHATSRFDLSLVMRDEGEKIVGGVEYATSLFDRETIQSYLGHLRNLIEAMVADDATTVDRLPLLTAAERHEMVERWNDTAVEYAQEVCIHELFEQQVHRSPDSVAVVDGQRSLTYAELNARANALAHHLRGLGVRDGENVVVLVPRSPELVIAELAVLKCGAAYVPIDPSFPPDRIAFMAEDSGARFLVARHADVLPELSAIARVDVDDPESANRTSTDLGVRVDGTAAAYVMYTSGSTGQPKGVVVPHRAVLRVVLNNRYAAFDRTDRVAFAANPAFDATTMEVWAPLLNGGCIVVIDQDSFLEPVHLAAALARHSVTALFVTTAIFNQCAAMVPNAFGGLRYLMTGGERCDPSAFARVLCEGKPEHLIHCYGPTETTTFATTWEVNDVPDGAQTLPIGKPIANTRIYILDAHGEPVPVGVSGEIFIGGSGVANGYLNRPELTAERFLPDPFSSNAGARMYRTGDVARWLADGNIEFVGRNDFQVKIRGFRIELGEIEARLDDHLAVREVVVLAREDNPGDKRLVAYYTGERLAAEELRAHVGATLPEYMVPAAYVHLDALPLASTGKVDRAALSAPEWSDYSIHGYRAPQGETETALAAIWCEVLGIEQVGRDDDFFELGGHSLLATKLVFRVKQKMDVEIELMDVFEASVLSALAERILDAQLAQFDPEELARISELVEKS